MILLLILILMLLLLLAVVQEFGAAQFDVSNRRRPVGKSDSVVSKSEWLPDAAAKDCACCGAVFTLVLRRCAVALLRGVGYTIIA